MKSLCCCSSMNMRGMKMLPSRCSSPGGTWLLVNTEPPLMSTASWRSSCSVFIILPLVNLVDGILHQVPRLILLDLCHLFFGRATLGQVFVEERQFSTIPAQGNVT